MKKKSSFESFIQEKLKENKFHYDASYWGAAQSRIAELKAIDDKKRKRRSIFWLFFFLLLSGFLTLGVWSKMQKDNQITPTQTPIVEVKTMPIETSPETLVSDFENHHSEYLDNEGNVLETSTNKLSDSKDITANLSTVKKIIKKSSTANVLNTEKEHQEILNINPLDSEKRVDDPEKFKDVSNSGLVVTSIRGNDDSKQIDRNKELLEKERVKTEDLISEKVETEVMLLNTLPTGLLENCNFPCLLLKSNKEDIGAYKINLDGPSPRSFTVSLHFASATSFSSSLENLRSTQVNLLANHKLNNRWKLSAGLGYSLFSGNVAAGGPEQLSYDFIARKTRYEWNLRRVHFLQIPVQLSFSLKPRHEISLGINNLYRLKTAGDLTIYQSTTFEDESSNSSKKGVDYGGVLPNWNVQIGLGYGFQFNHKTTIGLAYYHGLQDMIDDDFSGRKEKNNTSFAEIFLKYNLN